MTLGIPSTYRQCLSWLQMLLFEVEWKLFHTNNFFSFCCLRQGKSSRPSSQPPSKAQHTLFSHANASQHLTPRRSLAAFSPYHSILSSTQHEVTYKNKLSTQVCRVVVSFCCYPFFLVSLRLGFRRGTFCDARRLSKQTVSAWERVERWSLWYHIDKLWIAVGVRVMDTTAYMCFHHCAWIA